MIYLFTLNRYFRLLCLLAYFLSSASFSHDFLLANVYRQGIPLADYRVSEKLDGVRAYWNGRELISRQGNRFVAPAWFIEDFPKEPLDGELWMGRGTFEALSGIVRRARPDEGWRQVRFMAFDLPASSDIFDQRLQQLSRLVADSGSAFLSAVEHKPAAGHRELMRHLDEIVALGGEGLMLRRGDSFYRGGRSDDLLKVKKRDDAEARVVAHIPGKGKYRGQMGALLVEMANGRRFRLGTGFSDAVRASPPAPGAWVTFTYQGATAKGLPRFASFLRERVDINEPADE